MVISSFSCRGIYLTVGYSLMWRPFDTFALYFWWLVKLAQIMHAFGCYLYLLFMLCPQTADETHQNSWLYNMLRTATGADLKGGGEERGMDYGLLSSELCALDHIESQRIFRSLDWLENYFWRKGKGKTRNLKNFSAYSFPVDSPAYIIKRNVDDRWWPLKLDHAKSSFKIQTLFGYFHCYFHHFWLSHAVFDYNRPDVLKTSPL